MSGDVYCNKQLLPTNGKVFVDNHPVSVQIVVGCYVCGGMGHDDQSL